MLLLPLRSSASYSSVSPHYSKGLLLKRQVAARINESVEPADFVKNELLLWFVFSLDFR